VNLVSVRHDNLVDADRIVAIVVPGTMSAKRIIGFAKERGLFIDCCHSHRQRSVAVFDTGHVLISSLKPSTLRERIEEGLKSG